MTSILVCWAFSAIVVLWIGYKLGKVTRNSPWGILIDSRGRYSLTQFQLVLWTVIVISLIAAIAFGRLLGGATSATLGFEIPQEVLIVMGISFGSTAAVATVKASRDPQRVAASDEHDRPRLLQIFFVEEGQYADQVVDVTKFQNFWITVVVVVAYVALAIDQIRRLNSALEMTSVPGFSGTLLVLLGISHAGYVAGKLPSPQGKPSGLTLALKMQGAVPAKAAAAAAVPAPEYVPRNPQSGA